MRVVEKINDLVPVRTAVVSVMDKTGLDILIPGLITRNPEVVIFTTGGTHNEIKGIVTPEQLVKNIREVSEYTGQMESEGGLVKTLHHKLFLGYLTEDYCQAHQADLARENALPIDLLVVNLYPFQKTIEQMDTNPEIARMNIDVGGLSALWASAKNFHRVACLTSPKQYQLFLGQLQYNDGKTTLKMRLNLARAVWHLLAGYMEAVMYYFGLPDNPMDDADILNCYTIKNQSAAMSRGQ